MFLRSLQKTGEVDTAEAALPTAEGRFRADACEAAATLRPWEMMIVLTQTLAPKLHPNPPWSLKGMPLDGLSAWIKGQIPLMECVFVNIKIQDP